MFSNLEKFIKSRAEINSDTLTKICSYFELIKTNRNEILLKFDQISQHYYFVNKGIVRLFTISKTGDEYSRYFAFEGNFVTALPSFIDQEIAEEYLQTVEKSELLRVSREDFYHLVHTVPQFTKIYTAAKSIFTCIKFSFIYTCTFFFVNKSYNFFT